MREWYGRKTPEERRAHIARRDAEKVREQDRRKQARRRKDGSPEQKLKIESRKQVRLALARGDLVREVCEVESCTVIGQAHHADHAKPLEVQWMCRLHHDAYHAAQQEATEQS